VARHAVKFGSPLLKGGIMNYAEAIKIIDYLNKRKPRWYQSSPRIHWEKVVRLYHLLLQKVEEF